MRTTTTLRFAVLCIVLLASACGGRTTPAETARSIETKVWSPYCPGRLLIDCTTKQAYELRADIRERYERGESPDEILAWVRSEFGDEALAEPAAGWGTVIWLVPLAIFVTGAIVVVRVVRRGRSESAAA